MVNGKSTLIKIKRHSYFFFDKNEIYDIIKMHLSHEEILKKLKKIWEFIKENWFCFKNCSLLFYKMKSKTKISILDLKYLKK